MDASVRRSISRWWAGAAFTVVLTGCAGTGSESALDEPAEPTIDSIVSVLPPLELRAPLEVPTRDEVIAAYDRVVDALPDEGARVGVQRRLAELAMDVGEDDDADGRANPYAEAIARYTALLDVVPESDRAEVLYQLARAHDVSAQPVMAARYLDRLIREHPDSSHAIEAHFRRAEIAFSAEDYALAATHYGPVAAAGKDVAYWRNAAYMLGWSEFKSFEFERALPSFYQVLDDLTAFTPVEELPSTEEEMLRDTMRVTALTLGYLDGPDTLATTMTEYADAVWRYPLFEYVAEDHVAKERYQDAAATWRTFIEGAPLDARAPAAHERMIQTLLDGDFPTLVEPLKAEFVKNYGRTSAFWAHHDDAVRSTYAQTLLMYLEETSRALHAKAQAYDADDPGRRDAFNAAAEVYNELIDTDPGSYKNAEHLFLLGDVYTEAERFDDAADAYTQVLEGYPKYPKLAEAGYALVLARRELVTRSSEEDRASRQREQIDAQVAFAQRFVNDPRSPATHTDAASTTFALGEFLAATELARRSLRDWPQMPEDLRRTNLLIAGHGAFEFGDYVEAERAYHQLLRESLTGEQRDEVEERLVVAVYRQGEFAEAAGSVDTAVGHYMRIAELDPDSDAAARAHFDAVAILETAGRTPEASALLQTFRSRYPNHELGRDTDVRLANLYEGDGDWAAAAREYERVGRTHADPDVRRPALYRAGELYLETDAPDAAVAVFATYVDNYPQPPDIALEAVHHLDELHARPDQWTERSHWLRRKMTLRDAMGDAASERATYLAAEAAFALAEHERQRFASVALERPLAKSLERKQQALTAAAAAFQKTMSYEVADFVTAANFRLADLYGSLARELLESEAPANLSAMEVEQYEILLEEQAYPFEEQAIELHEINHQRSWDGVYDEWVEKSFAELGRLLPARYGKQETQAAYVDSIH